jgi:hypothetical protein
MIGALSVRSAGFGARIQILETGAAADGFHQDGDLGVGEAIECVDDGLDDLRQGLGGGDPIEQGLRGFAGLGR